MKFAVFEVDKKILGKSVLSGHFSIAGKKSILVYKSGNKTSTINYQTGHNLKNWWHHLHDLLVNFDITYVGLRMVHGGEEFTDTVKVNNQFLNRIKKYNKLAPLHNPAALDLADLVKKTWPKVKTSMSFDTAWYKDLGAEAYLYSLPISLYNKYKIRKYGFHGLSHEMATLYAAKMTNKKLNKLKVITCHLGAGSSITWYDSKVKDTTMGFSPNEGLTMATRSGDIPASVVFFLNQEVKMPLPKIKELLNKKSGLLGLAGMADLREVLLAAGYRVSGYKSSLKFDKKQKDLAKVALQIFIYDIKRYLASYIAMTKKLDAIVFTGAIADNALIRKMILKDLVKPKKCRVLVAPTGETMNLANKTLKCLK
ncbi:hypothetical protein HN859_01880 [Candidatus Parcubacteria bacterium]|nr:hypothetical protein [Candidatus Parcubacteria bacterium]